ncbi:GPI inositol-deacylase [Trichostrongylus colubriformis]|uniref:GPI inositol-deacylase n=1 Tax=Trichostrongylus colubriformis TaxID=6319 RepID=A0AAN8FJ61_TRICO
MARYIIPSVALPALYSAYRSYFYPNSPSAFGIRSLEDAINSLNANENTLEALRFLNQTPDVSYLSSLSPTALGVMALRGSELSKFVPVTKCEVDEDDLLFSKLLSKFNLGDDWNSALARLYRVSCPEEDLACPEGWLARRPSQVVRLYQLLRILFIKTEVPFDSSVVGLEIVPFLYVVFTQFRDSNKQLSLLALKILSNVALNAPLYAVSIFTSEWLHLLSNMVTRGKSLEERLLSHKICQNALNTLGVVDYQLRSDIYELFLPEKEPLVDLVLIHGLCGSVVYTWRQKDHSSNIVSDCWPKDWLHLDIPQPMRIIGIDYYSSLMQFTGIMESLQVRADRFKHQLEAAGIGKRPVIFICHSMGGLLAKRLLLDLPALAEKTVGILFIATPHRGSPIAAWGYSILHPTADVLFLLEENPLNKKLNEDFWKISDKIPVIVSMAETKESDLIGTAKGIIVPTQSAVYEKGAVYHIEEVHHNVCKPSERTSPSYGVVLNFLRDCIQEAKKIREGT